MTNTNSAWSDMQAQATATKTDPNKLINKINKQIMGANAPVKPSNGRSKQRLPMTKPTGLRGVYVHTDYHSRVPTGLYRASILPHDGGNWYALGLFKTKDTAAYVFNVYALTMGLANLVNHNIKPDPYELQQWRDKKPENVTREQRARTQYTLLWGTD